MNQKNRHRYTVMKILNSIFIVGVLVAVVLNITTLYYSYQDIPGWNNTINWSVLCFMISCILLMVNRWIKNKIVKDFMEDYLKEQNGEIIKSDLEEYLIKIEDKLFNVNVRFTKKGIFVLKQRASVAAEIEAHLFNGNKKTLKTSKYNNLWQDVIVNKDGDIEII
jgi:hypothetical protein